MSQAFEQRQDRPSGRPREKQAAVKPVNRPQVMKRPADTHKRTDREHHAAFAATFDTGLTSTNPSLFSGVSGARDQSPVMWPINHVRKTCQEQFPYTTPFRHGLPCILLGSGKPFQPLLATCRKTSVFRYRHCRLIQTVENMQPFAFARKLNLPRSPYVCLCVPDGRFIS